MQLPWTTGQCSMFPLCIPGGNAPAHQHCMVVLAKSRFRKCHPQQEFSRSRMYARSSTHALSTSAPVQHPMHCTMATAYPSSAAMTSQAAHMPQCRLDQVFLLPASEPSFGCQAIRSPWHAATSCSARALSSCNQTIHQHVRPAWREAGRLPGLLKRHCGSCRPGRPQAAPGKRMLSPITAPHTPRQVPCQLDISRQRQHFHGFRGCCRRVC
jgi:hypothetical protein